MRVLRVADDRADLAALLLLSIILATASLYPENYLSRTFPVTGTSGILPLSVLAFFMAAGTSAYIAIRRNAIKLQPINLLILLLFAFPLIRNATTAAELGAFKFFALGTGSFFLASILRQRRGPYLKYLLWVIAGISAATAFYGFFEYALQRNFIYQAYVQEAVPDPARGLHRIGSTFAHPVTYAAFLAQAIPFCVLASFKAANIKRRFAAAAIAILASMALFLTFSKGGWIAFAVTGTAAIVVLLRKHRHLMVMSLAAAMIFTAAIVTIFWQEINLEISSRADLSVNLRLVAWEAAADGIEDNWLTGVGLRNGSREIRSRIEPELLENTETKVVDNYYLSLLLEEGIIAAGLFVAVVVMLFLEGIKAARAGPGASWSLAALASMAALLLDAFTFDALLIWPNFLLFWLAAGIVHGTAQRGR